MAQTRLAKPKVKYSYGAYDKSDDKEQWIRISEGCPHDCPYCYEPQEMKWFGIPKIVRNDVKIMDMNLLCKEQALDCLKELAKKHVNGRVVYYDMVCGIDYRFLTPDIAQALKDARFRKIRIAWDWWYKDQYRIKEAIDMLKEAGYRTGKNTDIMVFMICNWKIPYKENLKKLDLCKVWGVQVADCYYDNQVKYIEPIHWTDFEIKDFRRRCRKHNQLVSFGIDPEIN